MTTHGKAILIHIPRHYDQDMCATDIAKARRHIYSQLAVGRAVKVTLIAFEGESPIPACGCRELYTLIWDTTNDGASWDKMA